MKTKINKYDDLEVWKRSHEFVLAISKYKIHPTSLEKDIVYKQLFRAAISIPTNIAEGMGRYSRKELLHFLIISRGSVEECRYLIHLIFDLKYIDSTVFTKLNSMIIEIGKMLNGLINSLKIRGESTRNH